MTAVEKNQLHVYVWYNGIVITYVFYKCTQAKQNFLIERSHLEEHIRRLNSDLTDAKLRLKFIPMQKQHL